MKFNEKDSDLILTELNDELSIRHALERKKAWDNTR